MKTRHVALKLMYEKGGVHPQELGDVTGTTRQNGSMVLLELMREGFVERDREDGRVSYRLTKNGVTYWLLESKSLELRGLL